MRAQWRRLAAAAKSSCSALFGRHLLVTNCTICCASSLCGDLISQRIENASAHSRQQQQKQQQQKQQQQQQRAVNWRRSGIIGCCALALGPLSHHWYLFLDRRFAGRSARALLTKTALDTALFSPLYICAYLLTLGLMRGSSGERLALDVRTTGWQIYKYEATVWSAAQLFNFYFLPTHLRVAFDNVLSLAFDTLYSFFYFSDRAD